MRAEFLCERDRRLFTSGPKRILSLDGGGTRGIVSLAFLERIEQLLSERAGRRTVIADHFDLIGGTSTGAIIATGLSLGLSASELIKLYLSLANKGFRGARFHGGLVMPKFRAKALYQQIQSQVGDETLGSERLRTGLAIVAKRIDSGSVWVFHNNPRGPYFDPENRTEGAIPNKDLKLARLVRASTAAPTFFAPERIEVAKGFVGTFVDGGVSPYNNPSLLLFMLATLQGYGFRWPCGADRLSLLSVGTGFRPMTPETTPKRYALSLSLALASLRSVMADTGVVAEIMLQWMGSCPRPSFIDGEIGDLSGDQLGGEALLTYQRYNIELSPGWMMRELGETLSGKELRLLCKMDRPHAVPRLLELARKAAERQVTTDELSTLIPPPLL